MERGTAHFHLDKKPRSVTANLPNFPRYSQDVATGRAILVSMQFLNLFTSQVSVA